MSNDNSEQRTASNNQQQTRRTTFTFCNQSKQTQRAFFSFYLISTTVRKSKTISIHSTMSSTTSSTDKITLTVVEKNDDPKIGGSVDELVDSQHNDGSETPSVLIDAPQRNDGSDDPTVLIDTSFVASMTPDDAPLVTLAGTSIAQEEKSLVVNMTKDSHSQFDPTNGQEDASSIGPKNNSIVLRGTVQDKNPRYILENATALVSSASNGNTNLSVMNFKSEISSFVTMTISKTKNHDDDAYFFFYNDANDTKFGPGLDFAAERVPGQSSFHVYDAAKIDALSFYHYGCVLTKESQEKAYIGTVTCEPIKTPAGRSFCIKTMNNEKQLIGAILFPFTLEKVHKQALNCSPPKWEWDFLFSSGDDDAEELVAALAKISAGEKIDTTTGRIKLISSSNELSSKTIEGSLVPIKGHCFKWEEPMDIRMFSKGEVRMCTHNSHQVSSLNAIGFVLGHVLADEKRGPSVRVWTWIFRVVVAIVVAASIYFIAAAVFGTDQIF